MTDATHALLHTVTNEVYALAGHEAATGRRLLGSTPTQRWVDSHAEAYAEIVDIERRRARAGA